MRRKMSFYYHYRNIQKKVAPARVDSEQRQISKSHIFFRIKDIKKGDEEKRGDYEYLLK